MSTYIPIEWKNGQAPYINAFNLNHIDAGIKSAHEEIDEILEDPATDRVTVKKAVVSETTETIPKATQTVIGGAKVWVDDTDPANVIGYIDAR